MKNVLIIGSGPAGLTAALYAARANLSPIVFEGNQPGGQLTMTTEVENFPGFPKGIQGPELMLLMKEQAQKFGAEFVSGNVTKAEIAGETKRVWVGEQEYEAKALIIATGASSRYLELPNEKKLIGRGLSTCATCDAFFYKGKEVAVLGGGDSAMEESNFISKFAEVTIINRRSEFRASKIMLDRAKNNPKIEFLTPYEVVSYDGQETLEGLTLKNTETGEQKTMKFDGVFLAIGHVPNTQLFKDQLELDELGYIVVKSKTNTSVEGVFTCGDVDDHRYRQAITAAGEGCKAAMDAEKWLEAR